MDKKQLLAAGAVALSALLLAGCAAQAQAGGGVPGPATTSGSSDAGTLATATTALGTIVVDGTGMTVYFYDKDVAGESASVCTGGCASAWPAVTTASETPSVSGITGTVGTIAGPGGMRQITLDGLPIYTYAGDSAPGDVAGQGSGGVWWVVNPDGSEHRGSGPTTDPGYSY